jgi:hypothetical protein
MAMIVDEYWGQGGSYLLDPKTGKRKLVERTAPATANTAPEELTNATTNTQTPAASQG